MEDTTGRKIIVLGLGYTVSDTEFQDYFSHFTGVVEATIAHDSLTGLSRGFGFVLFTTPESAQAMLQEHELRGPLMIKGRKVEPKLALPKGQVAPRRGQMMHGQSMGNSRIFVCRIPPTVGQDEVRAYFERYGALSDFYMPLVFETRQPRGIAFITYTSPESVEAVMQVNHELGGRQIAVDRATPKAEDNFWPPQGAYNSGPAYGRFQGMGLGHGWGPGGPAPPFAPTAPQMYSPYRPAGVGPAPRASFRPRPAYHPYASPYAPTPNLGMDRGWMRVPPY
eukprot:GGOE01036157.1.p1 GENE.GGOE01036157.1~~GGOE01036157.1.p1  ORF type:complete len:297 (-),score=14.30 GGOE01036157.1:122-961(-)